SARRPCSGSSRRATCGRTWCGAGCTAPTRTLERRSPKSATSISTRPPGSTVLCIDEMPGVQALEHCVPDHWGPGRPRDCPRREWEYSRHGTQTVIAAFDVRTGKVVATCSPTRKGKDLLRFVRRVAAQCPEGPVHVIWDNLNIHFDGPT